MSRLARSLAAWFAIWRPMLAGPFIDHPDIGTEDHAERCTCEACCHCDDCVRFMGEVRDRIWHRVWVERCRDIAKADAAAVQR